MQPFESLKISKMPSDHSKNFSLKSSPLWQRRRRGGVHWGSGCLIPCFVVLPAWGTFWFERHNFVPKRAKKIVFVFVFIMMKNIYTLYVPFFQDIIVRNTSSYINLTNPNMLCSSLAVFALYKKAKILLLIWLLMLLWIMFLRGKHKLTI